MYFNHNHTLHRTILDVFIRYYLLILCYVKKFLATSLRVFFLLNLYISIATLVAYHILSFRAWCYMADRKHI